MDLIIKVYNQYHILEMLTASVENMLVTSIDTTLETGVVPTQYIVIISTVRRQSDFDSRKLVSNVVSTLVRLLISAWVLSVFERRGPYLIGVLNLKRGQRFRYEDSTPA